MLEQKIVMVDEDDNIVKEISSYKGRIFGRASGLVIYNSNKEILLAKRSIKKLHYPGKWDLSVREGFNLNDSDYKDTITRESLEELSLDLSHFNLKQSVKVKSNKYFTQWFVVEINKDLDFFQVDKEEVDDLKWMKINNFEIKLRQGLNEFTDTTKIHYDKIKYFEKGLF